MRRGARWSLGVGAMLAPVSARAADAARTAVLDFAAPGPLRDYLGLSMKVAWGYFTLAVIAAVVLEAIASGPGTPRNYAEVIWRIVLIVFLLWNYQRIFGFVMHVTDDVADRLTPQDALDEYHKYLDQAYAEEEKKLPPPDSVELSKLGGPAISSRTAISKWSLGNMLVDGFMGVMVLIAKGIVYAVERFGRILAAVMFVVGPLALVAGIPRQSGTGGRWFRYFVSVSSWPIFSGLVLGVMTAVAKQSVLSRAGSPTSSLVTAFVMILCALASPLLAGWIVGGATHGALATGLFAFMGLTRLATKAVHNLSEVVHKTYRAALGTGGKGPAGPGGPPAGGGGGQVAANSPGFAPRGPGGGYGPAREGGRGGGGIGRNAPGRARWTSGSRREQGQGAGGAGSGPGSAGTVAANPPSKPGGTSGGQGARRRGSPSSPRQR
jgi:hypothetical protein